RDAERKAIGAIECSSTGSLSCFFCHDYSRCFGLEYLTGAQASSLAALPSRTMQPRRLRSSRLRNGRRLRRIRGLVIENAIAVVAGDDFAASAHIRHHLRPQSHEASGASAVARFGHRDAVANTRDDPVIERGHRLRQLLYQPFAFRTLRFQFFLLPRHLLVELEEARLHVLA